jgi:cephalosporin hydroxylase
MYTLQNLCIDAFFKGSDINQHIPVLYFLAMQCDTVTELGVRWGTSSLAFLHSRARLRSYDIEITTKARELFDFARSQGKDAELIQADSLNIENFEKTDLLFIDTKHTSEQAIQELYKYHSHVKKWIVLHDTELFGETGEDKTLGLNHAVTEFLLNYPEWQIGIKLSNNNGLTILSRT